MNISALLQGMGGFAPGACAIVDDHGALPASMLHSLVAAETRWLAAAGCRRVGLLADNGRAWAISDLALLAARIVNVPLPQHFGPAQLAHALQTSAVQAVLTDAPRQILDLDLGFIELPGSRQTGLALLARPPMQSGAAALPPGTVKVTYTSGSTAEPKGVCLSGAALEAVARSVTTVASRLGIARHLSLLPLATLLENVAGFYASLLGGATCYLPSAPARAIAGGTLAAQTLLGEVSRLQPESMILVPELLRILVTGAESSWRAPASGRFFAVGGARVSPTLLERAAAVGLPVFEGYGLSECASVVCLNTPEAARRGSVGRPLPHVRLRIGNRSEIHVSGAVMGGYVGDANRWPAREIATGDCGECDADGFVYVTGRLKNIFINSFGRNLSPEWIESELCQEAPIGQVVVSGEARPQVVAVIVPSHAGIAGGALAQCVARANARLPDYARVARYHVAAERFSVANGLLTGNGRPRRERVLERYADTISRLHEDAEATPAEVAQGGRR